MEKKLITNNINLFLLKKDVPVEKCLKENFEVFELTETKKLYIKNNKPKNPSWVNKFFLKSEFLKENFGKSEISNYLSQLYNSHSSALLIIPIFEENNEYVFILSFGYGRFMINLDFVEQDFGLKVALNLINPESIKSLDKTNLSIDKKNVREQNATGGSLISYNIDFSEDLIKNITGKTSDSEIFGQLIGGKDSLILHPQVNLDSIDGLLKKLIPKIKSDIYLNKFPGINNFKPIRDKEKIKDLKEILIKNIQDRNTENLILSVPEIADFNNIEYFKYNKNSGEYDFLSIEDFYIELNKLKKINYQNILETKILVKLNSSDSIVSEWSIFKCLIAEIHINDKLFLLNDGLWYSIDDSFKRTLDDFINSITFYEKDLIKFDKAIHPKECDYNRELANHLHGYLLDSKLINHPQGIEVCDLITNQKEIFHNKRYNGSASLSHLFFQGFVSSKLLVSDKKFLEKTYGKFNNLLPPNLIPMENFQAGNYTIVFGIIKKNSSNFKFPIFSQVSLKKTIESLEPYGFKVKIALIDQIPQSKQITETSQSKEAQRKGEGGESLAE